MNDFIGIGIVGVALSLFQAWLNKKYDLSSPLNRAFVVLASIVVGMFYVWLRNSGFYETVIGILAAASTVYALFLNAPKDVKIKR